MTAPKTVFLTNDNLTRKRWAKDLFKVILPAVEFNDLVGKGSDAIVQGLSWVKGKEIQLPLVFVFH